MTPNEGIAVNLGAAMREGLRLHTVEVVALLHNACCQLDAGSAAALPSNVDDLWITDAGTLVLPHLAPVAPTRVTVALLLETLLRDRVEATEVPAALRSLPARLRDSGATSNASDLRDLLTILRWHLPSDSTDVLRDLVTRARLTSAAPESAAAIELFADEGPVALPAARPAAQSNSAGHRSHAPLAAAVLALLIIAAAGYAGYRVTASRIEPAVPERADTSISVTPRISPAAKHITPAEGTDPRALDLAVTGGAFSPSFASGGSALIFHAGRNTTGRLFQASLDDRGHASALTPLLDERGRAYHARLSPDGRSIAYDSDRDGERGVYVASRDGAINARVSGDGFAAVPSWSPDMKWLAFVRAEPSRPKVWNLWLRDITTGTLTRQSTFRSGQVWGASWFPDARALCYSHEDRLIIADTKSGSTRTLESPIEGRLIRTPAVSPDGTRIVFQVYRDGAWLVDVHTGEMRRLINDATAEEFAWAPDGNHIAYHSRRDGQWRIWMLPV